MCRNHVAVLLKGHDHAVACFRVPGYFDSFPIVYERRHSF